VAEGENGGRVVGELAAVVVRLRVGREEEVPAEPLRGLDEDPVPPVQGLALEELVACPAHGVGHGEDGHGRPMVPRGREDSLDEVGRHKGAGPIVNEDVLPPRAGQACPRRGGPAFSPHDPVKGEAHLREGGQALFIPTADHDDDLVHCPAGREGREPVPEEGLPREEGPHLVPRTAEPRPRTGGEDHRRGAHVTPLPAGRTTAS